MMLPVLCKTIEIKKNRETLLLDGQIIESVITLNSLSIFFLKMLNEHFWNYVTQLTAFYGLR